MTEQPKTQREAVERHLKDWGHLTSLDAFRDYGITRLSSIIFNMRKDGWNINTLDQKTTNRYGNSVTYALYQLIAEQGQTAMKFA